MQIAVYELKIADVENRIKRLQDHNDELQDEIKSTNESFSVSDSESAEQIKILKRQISEKADKIENDKKKVKEFEDSRREDKSSHELKVEMFQEKYRQKRKEMLSQIKTASAEINALENFKKVQEVMRQKLDSGDSAMAENETKVQEILDKIERKFKIDRETLKKEMYARLLVMAANFQMEVAEHLSFSVRKLMRENIMLKSESIQIATEESKKIELGSNLKKMMDESRRNVIDRKREIRKNLIFTKIQKHLIKFLDKCCAGEQNRFSVLPKIEFLNESTKLLEAERSRERETKIASDLSKITVRWHKEMTKLAVGKNLRKKMDCRTKRCLETLYDLKYILSCTCTNTEICTAGRKLDYSALVSELQHTLTKGISNVKRIRVRSSETIITLKKDDSWTDLFDKPEFIDSEISIDAYLKTILKRSASEATKEATDSPGINFADVMQSTHETGKIQSSEDEDESQFILVDESSEDSPFLEDEDHKLALEDESVEDMKYFKGEEEMKSVSDNEVDTRDNISEAEGSSEKYGTHSRTEFDE